MLVVAYLFSYYVNLVQYIHTGCPKKDETVNTTKNSKSVIIFGFCISSNCLF